MSTQNQTCFIFDCDGVLVDSEKISIAVLRDTVEKDGLILTFEQCRDLFMGLSMESCLSIIEEKTQKVLGDNYFDDFYDQCYKQFRSSIEPIPGIAQILQNLKHEFCVASSGSYEKMNITLGTSRIKDYFADRIYSASEVERGKPFPDLFLYAAQQMNYKPENCLVIEDSFPGVQAAKAAGMKVIYFCRETPIQEALEMADGFCDDMRDLLQISKNLI